MTPLQVTVVGRRALVFDDGAPVRSASAIAAFGDGWLVAQDDATSAAWLDPARASVRRLRLLPPVGGRDLFSEAVGTKRAKPDVEAACTVTVGNGEGVLLLGSGSLPNRMRAVLVVAGDDAAPAVAVADLTDLYARVRQVLELAPAQLNLEGACVVGDRLRWFQRGLAAADVPSASVDLPVTALVDAVRGTGPLRAVTVTHPQRYELGRLGGVPLAVTDAVALPGGRIVVSAAAEDTPDAVADGPVVGVALVLLDGTEVVGSGAVDTAGVPLKVEGLALVSTADDGAELLAVVDQDDPEVPSLALYLAVRWG